VETYDREAATGAQKLNRGLNELFQAFQLSVYGNAKSLKRARRRVNSLPALMPYGPTDEIRELASSS
jgi:hypothetical protein